MFLVVPVTKVHGSLTIVATWNDNLNDTNSTEYKEFTQEVETKVC